MIICILNLTNLHLFFATEKNSEKIIEFNDLANKLYFYIFLNSILL